MVGPSTICLPSVFVGNRSQQTTPLTVRLEATLASDTIRWGICWRRWWRKCALTFALNQSCNRSLGKYSIERPQSPTDEARLDIEARGFWECRQECTMFDVRVFNSCAESYRHAPLPTLHRRQEQLKRNAYEERVWQVERATFVPLVFTTSGSATWVCLFYCFAGFIPNFVRSTSCFVFLPSIPQSSRLVPLYCFVVFFIYC